jgi:methylglutaconyl-CoA hydratase
MADELVHYAVDGGIATITLDSPGNRNALSARLRGELAAALRRAHGQDEVRAVVLSHTGPVFCSGMDLEEPGGASGEPQAAGGVPAILGLLWSSAKPVVARLAGPARAGGLGIVAACDIAVAASSATFAFSEVRIGVIPALISAVVLPRLAPRAAQELFLTGERFDAARAERIGLRTSAVPDDELDTEVARYTSMLALAGPQALAGTKELLTAPRSARPTDDFERLQELSASYFAGAEAAEGMAAFREKRTPSWVPESGRTA